MPDIAGTIAGLSIRHFRQLPRARELLTAFSNRLGGPAIVARIMEVPSILKGPVMAKSGTARDS